MAKLSDEDSFGWSYKIDLNPYISMEQEIIDISNKFDKEMEFGCGFMLAFFHLSINELEMFQKDYGYFPYDAYLDLWQRWTDRFGTDRRVNYNQRNKCLEALVKAKIISGFGRDTYSPINNPFEKIVNRMNNLENLLG